MLCNQQHASSCNSDIWRTGAALAGCPPVRRTGNVGSWAAHRWIGQEECKSLRLPCTALVLGAAVPSPTCAGGTSGRRHPHQHSGGCCQVGNRGSDEGRRTRTARGGAPVKVQCTVVPVFHAMGLLASLSLPARPACPLCLQQQQRPSAAPRPLAADGCSCLSALAAGGSTFLSALQSPLAYHSMMLPVHSHSIVWCGELDRVAPGSSTRLVVRPDVEAVQSISAKLVKRNPPLHHVGRGRARTCWP